MVVRCSTTGDVHLGVVACVDTLSFLLMASDGAGFEEGDSAVQDMARKSRINLARAQSHFDTKFRFTRRVLAAGPGSILDGVGLRDKLQQIETGT
jgi:hypothetical protein